MLKNNTKKLKPDLYHILNLHKLPNLSFYFCIVYVFITDSYIEHTPFLVQFASIFDDILPAIENTANISYHYGLYYKMKLSLVVGIFIGLIMFFPTLYLFGKIYLSSLGFIKSCDKKYISKYLLKSPAYKIRIFSHIVFIFITILGLFIFYFLSDDYNGYPIQDLMYGFIGVSFFSIVMFIFFIFYLIFLIFETFSYFYKLKNIDKFLSKEEFEIYFIVNERYKKEIQSRYKKTFFQKFKNMLLLREYDEKIFENISTQEEKEIKEKIQKEVKLELEKKREKKDK